MANCTYCGVKAGIFKDHHPECKQRHLDGWSKMIALATETVIKSENVDNLPATLSEVAKSSFIGESEVHRAMVLGWGQALDHFLDDSLLSETEQERLLAFAQRFNLSQEELNLNGSAFDRAVKAKILADLCEGRIPIAEINFQLPFNLKKSEEVVYLFKSVGYLEERARTTYVGRSHGVSVRVMKGVYYRTGAFKGTPVKTSQMEFVDSGLFLVTSENLYYQGEQKSFRIPYSKIVSFTHYSDGIGLQREAASARPQVFVTGDGWFTCNLIENLARLSEARR